ncbi:restriction endonuclease subunit S [Formosa sp. PL04]|uniref:restriction endonuclease subunit S n=1 Tax=Formosa sp. PL04 TaxID=3081755 RepID=UPI0029823B35|nr:restriction endonuclease subunit S [Formosa sp. PL04]MDW5288873.1 restriction endonuclease subunit S [Formosa sp. PL04]
MAKEYLIGKFLKRIKRPIELEPNQYYNLVTIKMNHKGVVLRGSKKGSDIKSKMFQVKEGDFILSGIDARNGAFGIVPKELEGAIVTNDFWYFEIDENIILKQLFLELTTMSWFDEICRKGSDGTTQRIRLQKDKFFNQKILLPDTNEQKKLSDKILTFKIGQASIDFEIESQKNNIINLRQAILLEAVQGKLTADWRVNNPDTEDASQLLKRIQEEKTQLIKDKKIKKEKVLPPITKEEIPYELPEGWVWSKLGIISLIVGGGTPKSSNPEYFCEEGISWFTPADLGKSKLKYVKNGRRDITELGLKKSSAQLMPKGSVMFSSRAPIGHTAIGLKDFSTNQGFKSSVPYFMEMNEYIYIYLNSIVKDTNENASGTTFKEVSGTIVKNFLFPLPPLEEQKAIVEKVNVSMGLCDALEQEVQQSQEHSEQLMQSVLREVFEPNNVN